MHALKSLGRFWLLLSLTGLYACGPKPACRHIESNSRSMHSWAAVAEMVAREWGRGEVPTSYARHTLQKGGQQIRRAAAKLDQASAPADPVAQAARARYGQLAALLARIGEAMGKGDRGQVAMLAARLPALDQQLGELRDRCQAREQAQTGKKAS